MKPYYVVILILLFLCSCSKRVNPTEVVVEDPVRHYLPILQGSEFVLNYKIQNVGKNTLVITDVQSSCGCLILDSYTGIIPSKKEGIVRLKFNSSKNIGYVSNVIRVYGNMFPEGILLLEFDINVVPNSGFVSDYEEKYKKYLEDNLSVEDLVDGNFSYKRYYVNSEYEE